LHIPLQSGNDKILKLMNRPYDIKYFQTRINKIRQYISEVAITTDVIVGFPGESEKDHKETHDFINNIEFSRLHVFSFSSHEKTRAAKMKNMVNEDDIKKRSKDLRVLSNELKKKYKDNFKNSLVKIVLEKIKDDFYFGKSEHYIDYKFLKNSVKITKNIKIGAIIKVKV
jgi:threonylcarbamoyladenosine tRNA methylthiotransferase MtaB